MRIRDLRIIHARIPLRKRVKHASHSRTETDSIFVCCKLDDGSFGWGEGLPREYVTGETIDTAWQHLTEAPPSHLTEEFQDAAELRELVSRIRFSPTPGKRQCFGNSARCALELAILDAGCRSLSLPLAEFIRSSPIAAGISHKLDEVRYSAIMTATGGLKLRLRSWLFRYYGFRQCKIKVGVPGKDDRRLLKIVRRIFGANASIRVDANEAWNVQEAAARIRELEQFRIESVEQPVPHAEVEKLSELRKQVSTPIMLDESLCSMEDADKAIERGLCDSFNIRLSKCGGILPSVELAARAHRAGLSSQLGCQVGETGILSAAGRHFASAISGLTAVEGSFDRLLVREPLTREDLTFGQAGLAPALPGPGLGITIDEQAVERVKVKEITIPLP